MRQPYFLKYLIPCLASCFVLLGCESSYDKCIREESDRFAGEYNKARKFMTLLESGEVAQLTSIQLQGLLQNQFVLDCKQGEDCAQSNSAAQDAVNDAVGEAGLVGVHNLEVEVIEPLAGKYARQLHAHGMKNPRPNLASEADIEAGVQWVVDRYTLVLTLHLDDLEKQDGAQQAKTSCESRGLSE